MRRLSPRMRRRRPRAPTRIVTGCFRRGGATYPFASGGRRDTPRGVVEGSLHTPSANRISAMKTVTLLALAAAGLIAVGSAHADAAGRTVRRGAVETADGGIAAGKAVGYRGPNGAAGVRGHGVATDGQGDATVASGAAGRTANG